jgi:hypothetical protein
MFIKDLALLGTLWYLMQSLSVLFQSLGYAFGFLLGSWAFNRYFPADRQ